MGKSAREQISKRANRQKSESAKEQISKRANQQESKSAKEQISKRANRQKSKSAKEQKMGRGFTRILPSLPVPALPAAAGEEAGRKHGFLRGKDGMGDGTAEALRAL